MCEPTTLLLASTALSVTGQLQQGRAQQKAANAEAAQLEYQAAVSRDNALVQARNIRRVGMRERGATLAGIVASGIRVGQGSALDAEREVVTDSETDASMAILNGEREARGLDQQASNTRRAGRNARRASYFAAATSLLGAGAQGARMGMGGQISGWDASGYSGLNDRSTFSTGDSTSWFMRNGSSGD